MKNKYFFFLLTLLMINGFSFAQRNAVDGERENFFRFGAKAGLNANKITGASYKDGFNYNFQAGGFLQFNITKRFGLQPEVNFVQSTSEFTDDAGTVYDDIFRDGGQKKAALNYLEIPVFLNINLGNSKRVKLQVGPSYGGLLKETVDSLQTGGDIYKKAEWSGIAGLWIQLPVVNLGARYKIGFTDINAIDDQQTWRNQAIQLFVGVTF